MSKIKTVGIVGTGVIGTGWIIRNLAHNKIVHAYDQNKNLKNYVLKEIKRTSKSIKKLFGKKILIKIFKKEFNNRKIIPIDCSELIWGFGAIHCLTQQEPK